MYWNTGQKNSDLKVTFCKRYDIVATGSEFHPKRCFLLTCTHRTRDPPPCTGLDLSRSSYGSHVTRLSEASKGAFTRLKHHSLVRVGISLQPRSPFSAWPVPKLRFGELMQMATWWEGKSPGQESGGPISALVLVLKKPAFNFHQVPSPLSPSSVKQRAWTVISEIHCNSNILPSSDSN